MEGQAAGAALREGELLGGLREAGLIAYPSPLLGGLLEHLPEVLAAEVLPRLGPAARTVLAQVARPWRAAVVASGLSLAGTTEGVPLKLAEFVGSVGRLAWARENGCKWTRRTCAVVAEGGQLEVLKWAREHNCPWHARTCHLAARGGHLELLQWARDHGWGLHSSTSQLNLSRL